jgi:LacI family transcriptional regulator
VEKGGYEAGRLMDQLIHHQREEPFNIVIRPTRFELRKSTEKYNITNEYILQVVHYIEKHFTSEINIEELTRLVPLSRRNLEVKFKNEMGTTIYQFILNCRIDYFTHLLLTTNRPLFDLSIDAGFSDYKNISRLFKRMKGCTPLEYREKFGDKDISNVF